MDRRDAQGLVVFGVEPYLLPVPDPGFGVKGFQTPGLPGWRPWPALAFPHLGHGLRPCLRHDLFSQPVRLLGSAGIAAECGPWRDRRFTLSASPLSDPGPLG